MKNPKYIPFHQIYKLGLFETQYNPKPIVDSVERELNELELECVQYGVDSYFWEKAGLEKMNINELHFHEANTVQHSNKHSKNLGLESDVGEYQNATLEFFTKFQKTPPKNCFIIPCLAKDNNKKINLYDLETNNLLTISELKDNIWYFVTFHKLNINSNQKSLTEYLYWYINFHNFIKKCGLYDTNKLLDERIENACKLLNQELKQSGNGKSVAELRNIRAFQQRGMLPK